MLVFALLPLPSPLHPCTLVRAVGGGEVEGRALVVVAHPYVPSGSTDLDQLVQVILRSSVPSKTAVKQTERAGRS